MYVAIQLLSEHFATMVLALNKKSKFRIRHKLHIFGKEFEPGVQKHKKI